MENDRNEDLIVRVERWGSLMNERAHAGLFAWETVEDKQIIERATASEWAKSAVEKYGIVINNIVSNPDPKGVPDCYGRSGGERIALELTELVDGNFLDDIKRARVFREKVTPYDGRGFSKTQWDKERFGNSLLHRINSKEIKYRKSNHVIDVLIIHTDEPWLSPNRVENWLPHVAIPAVPTLRSAYLLMTHVPGSPTWPLFRLFADEKPPANDVHAEKDSA